MAQTRKPDKRSPMGRISAANWSIPTEDRKDWFNVELTRASREGDERQHAAQFGCDDLPILTLKGRPMQAMMIAGKFDGGCVVVTEEVQRETVEEDRFVCLIRHANGDWGVLPSEDWEVNEAALKYGGRFFSRYRGRNGTLFYIITDADRLTTTILLPSEY